MPKALTGDKFGPPLFRTLFDFDLNRHCRPSQADFVAQVLNFQIFMKIWLYRSTLLLLTALFWVSCSKDKVTLDKPKTSVDAAKSESELEEALSEIKDSLPTANDDAGDVTDVPFPLAKNFDELGFLRLEQLEKIHDSSEMSEKIQAAKGYFRSFNFQAFGSLAPGEHSTTKEELTLLDVKEFFHDMRGYILKMGPDKKDEAINIMADIRGPKSNPHLDSLYALAAALHISKKTELQTSESFDQNTLSIYQIILNALSKQGESTLSYEVEINKQKEIANYILQLRYNILLWQVISQLKPNEDNQNFWSSFSKQVDSHWAWSPKFEKMDPSSLRHLIPTLYGAIHLRNFMEANGMEIRHSLIGRFLGSIRISQFMKKMKLRDEDLNLSHRGERNISTVIHLLRVLRGPYIKKQTPVDSEKVYQELSESSVRADRKGNEKFKDERFWGWLHRAIRGIRSRLSPKGNGPQNEE